MKNVLFATTALIATAGIAAAEVSLSGSAEMGITGGNQGIGYDAAGDTVSTADQFVTDIDVTFTLSGESDNGITFGATIDLDESQDSNGNFADDDGGPEAVFISGDFGTLTMGDTDGALDKAVAETDLIGDITDASTDYSVKGWGQVDGRLDGQVARYDYSVAGFGLSLSAETDDNGNDDTVWGFGATYSVAGFNFGAGFQGGESDTSYTTDPVTLVTTRDGGDTFEAWAVSAGTTFGMVDVVANYGEITTNIDGAVDPVTAIYNIAAVYTMDALSLGANYGEAHIDGTSTDKGFGLAANYDLGGGLVLQAGYGEGVTDNVGGAKDKVVNEYSLGLSMSF